MGKKAQKVQSWEKFAAMTINDTTTANDSRQYTAGNGKEKRRKGQGEERRKELKKEDVREARSKDGGKEFERFRIWPFKLTLLVVF